MARSPKAQHKCQLYNRIVSWSECYEVQEVREDEMDMELLVERFDMELAREACAKCKWYVIDNS